MTPLVKIKNYCKYLVTTELLYQHDICMRNNVMIIFSIISSLNSAMNEPWPKRPISRVLF